MTDVSCLIRYTLLYLILLLAKINNVPHKHTDHTRMRIKNLSLLDKYYNKTTINYWII
jgi:hypothetical protein